jgi:RHS repeat-associated protein
LHLSDEELTSSGGTVTGTRYYTLGATTVAARTSASGVAYLIGDQQNTSTLAISASSLALTHRYYDPYGNPLGTVTSFPTGGKGFVGGAADTATGLTNLGIRQYQPNTASFISTDPILTPYTPQDLNPYAYATDDPATKADPTGASPGPEIRGPNGCQGTTPKAVIACIQNDIKAHAHPNAKAELQQALNCFLHVPGSSCTPQEDKIINQQTAIANCLKKGPSCAQYNADEQEQTKEQTQSTPCFSSNNLGQGSNGQLEQPEPCNPNLPKDTDLYDATAVCPDCGLTANSEPNTATAMMKMRQA